MKKSNKKNLLLKVNDFSKGIELTCGENITSMSNSVMCYNFDFNSGVLTEGFGFKEFTTPISKDSDDVQIPIMYDDFEAEILSLYLFRHNSVTYHRQRDKLLFYASDGYVWYTLINDDYPTTTRLSHLAFGTEPNIFSVKLLTRDAVMLSNGIDEVGSWNGDGVPGRHKDCPKFISLCNYKGRMFYIKNDDQSFYYTKNFRPTQWTETPNEYYEESSVEINDGQGKLNKLLCFKGHMYIFRDYNILKVTCYDDSQVPLVQTVYTSGDKIYASTVQICGNNILMLTRNGILSFDGNNASLIDLKFSKLFNNIDNKNAVSAFHNGKYYLACKLNFSGDSYNNNEANFNNNALVSLDVTSGKYTITRGIDIKDMLSLQADCLNKLILCFNSQNQNVIGEITQDGKFFDDNTKKVWSSPFTDLGYSGKNKVITNISFVSKYPCKITLFTEKESKVFSVDGTDVNYKFPVRISGNNVGFTIQTDYDKAYISNIQMNIDLIDMENII